MTGLWYAARCRLGIALKEIGCALIHGWGRHCWEFEEHGASCRSCGKHRDVAALDVEGAALSAWRRVRSCWGAVTEPPIVWAGRLGCRVLDRHHYLACRGRSDHGTVGGRIQRVRVVDGRWVPVRPGRSTDTGERGGRWSIPAPLPRPDLDGGPIVSQVPAPTDLRRESGPS